MTVTTYKWSIAQWHQLVDSGVLEGKPVELLEGEIIQVSPKGIPHSYTNRAVADYLRELLRDRVYVSEAHPITLDKSEPEPDIAIIRLPQEIYQHHHPYPEDIYWVIEIANKTLKLDIEIKAKIYAQAGISEYWVIDLVNKKLIVYTELDNESYTQIQELITGTIASQVFPDILIDLDKLL